MKEFRDYTINKTPSLFDSVTARRITWAVMACAVAYFGISFLSLLH